MSNYTRVLPRDLFNESKLLKCIGRVTLLMHDNQAPKNLTYEITYGMALKRKGFDVLLSPEGSLRLQNLPFFINENNHILKIPYNSKGAYPLYMELPDLSEIEVLNDEGNFTEEFIDYCKQLEHE